MTKIRELFERRARRVRFKLRQNGVGKVHIVDGKLRHSLLLEIYTNHGVGTQIVSEPAA